MIPPLEGFHKNYNELIQLFDVHAGITEGIQGRGRTKTPIIHKSCTVMICSCLEVYFESMIIYASKLYIKKLKSHELLSDGMKVKISDFVRSKESKASPLSLCGDGWKDIYLEIVKNDVSALNTPKYKNISKLFKVAFNIDDLSLCWTWNGMTSSAAQKKLDEIVTIRGDIAHGTPVAGLNVQKVTGYANYSWFVAEKTTAFILDYIDN